MDEYFFESIESRILDFATDKRLQWEKEHKLYSVIFEITPKCNFNCVHCYLHDHHSGEELSYDRIIEIIDILYEKEVLFLTFTGGDVFTRKDFKNIYLYAKKKGFIVEIYTNGSLINDELIEIFRKYPPLLIDISLYGSCEETYKTVTEVSGAFQKVINNIEKLISANIRVSLKAPVLNIYYSELPEMKAIAEKYDLPFRTGFEIFPSIDKDDSVQNYAVPMVDSLRYEFGEFEKRPRTFGEEYDVELVNLQEQQPLFRCKLGRASCVIDHSGNMCPCMSFRHAGKKLTSENFDSIWSSFSQYPKMKASKSYKCLSCKAYDFCDICPAMMQFIHDDFEYVDEHFCKSAWARYERYFKGVPTEEVLGKIK